MIDLIETLLIENIQAKKVTLMDFTKEYTYA